MSQIPLSETASADRPEYDKLRDDKTRQIAPDLAYRQIAIVNVIFYGRAGAGDRNWTLIDTGMPGAASDIRSAAQARFGGVGRPSSIVLTHGHFDHVGPLETLAREWDVPVYAHKLEHSYMNGAESYPPPDPMVGGGLMSLLSPLYPRKPVDVSERLRPLPDDGSVPGMPGWRWLHTPGHTPGHVSLWRESDACWWREMRLLPPARNRPTQQSRRRPKCTVGRCTSPRTGSALGRRCKAWLHSRLMSS